MVAAPQNIEPGGVDGVTLHTDRLLLRPWRDSDLAPFAALNADPEVMEWFPNAMSREESDGFAQRIRSKITADGWGLWAVEVVDSGEFIGFTGLAVPSFEAHFTPAVEIGWRLTRSAWGFGYASEAASAALDYAFSQLNLSEVVSFTSLNNQRSQALMKRLGMVRDPADDFARPELPADHRLSRHVLYRMSADHWR